MIPWRIPLLASAVTLFCSCGGGDQKAENQQAAAAKGNATANATQPIPEPAVTRKAMQEVALYTNSVGAVFEILEISEDPINDTVPLEGFFDAGKQNPKSQNHYVNGKLVERIEYIMRDQRHLTNRVLKYWGSGVVKQEIQFGGNPPVTNNFNEAGFPIGPNAAPGRRNIWFLGRGPNSIGSLWRNKDTNYIRQIFGPPDRVQGNTWFYKNMLFKQGNRTNMLTVQFHIGGFATNIVVGR